MTGASMLDRVPLCSPPAADFPFLTSSFNRMLYFYCVNGIDVQGPTPVATLKDMYSARQLPPKTKVCVQRARPNGAIFNQFCAH